MINQLRQPLESLNKMSEFATRPFNSEAANLFDKDERESLQNEVEPIPETGRVGRAPPQTVQPVLSTVNCREVVVGKNIDDNEQTESRPLLESSRRRRKYWVIATLLCLMHMVFLSFSCVVVCHVIGAAHSPIAANITRNVSDQYSCTGVYTLLASFGDCSINSCDLSEIVVTAADLSKPDQVLVFLTKCNNIIHGSTDEGCADDCHIKSPSRISSLLPSNDTQTCTLDVCRSNVDRGCIPDSTVCTLNITKRLLLGGRGTDFCLLSMGVSAGDNSCQRTNLTVQFRYSGNIWIIVWTVCWASFGIIVAVTVIYLIVVKRYCKEPARPTMREDEQGHGVYQYIQTQ